MTVLREIVPWYGWVAFGFGGMIYLLWLACIKPPPEMSKGGRVVMGLFSIIQLMMGCEHLYIGFSHMDWPVIHYMRNNNKAWHNIMKYSILAMMTILSVFSIWEAFKKNLPRKEKIKRLARGVSLLGFVVFLLFINYMYL